VKTWIITKFELKRVVRKKWFIISTLLTPLFVILYASFPALLGKFANRERTLGIIDPTGRIVEEIERVGKGEKFEIPLKVRRLSSLEEGFSLLRKKELDAVLKVPEDIFSSRKATLYMRNVGDVTFLSVIKERLNKIIQRDQLRKIGLKEEVLKEILAGVKIETLKVEKGKVKKETMESSFTLYMIFSLLLFMGLIGYGQILLRRVLEDKRFRVVEILYSSARPMEVFAGKLLGVGLAGILQLLFWLFLGLAGYFYASTYLPQFRLPGFMSKFVIFLLFFFAGFFLYSTIFLTVGSIVESEEEAQHLLGPIMMMISLPFALSFILFMTPDNWIKVALSYFPYTAPFFMMMRAIISSPSAVEIGISLLLVFLASVVSVWISARIFRVGMLHSGARPTISQLISWVKEG